MPTTTVSNNDTSTLVDYIVSIRNELERCDYGDMIGVKVGDEVVVSAYRFWGSVNNEKRFVIEHEHDEGSLSSLDDTMQVILDLILLEPAIRSDLRSMSWIRRWMIKSKLKLLGYDTDLIFW